MDVLLIGIIDGNPSRDGRIIITHTGSERVPVIDKPIWLSVKALPLCTRQIYSKVQGSSGPNLWLQFTTFSSCVNNLYLFIWLCWHDPPLPGAASGGKGGIMFLLSLVIRGWYVYIYCWFALVKCFQSCLEGAGAKSRARLFYEEERRRPFNSFSSETLFFTHFHVMNS